MKTHASHSGSKSLMLLLVLFAFLTGQSLGLKSFAQSCITPSTGATINTTGATQIYVDATSGADNPSCGASGSPCKTINYGLSQASTHSVAQVNVNAGTYREAVTLPASYNENASSNTLIIKATAAGTAIVEGADQWTGWTNNGNGTFSKSWPYTWGYAGQPFSGTGGPALSCVGLRREMMFINGTPMTQQLQGALTTAGTFSVVDNTADSAGVCPTLSGTAMITVYPPAGTNMSTADIEVSTRGGSTTASTGGLFNAPNGAANLEVSGLVFQHDNTPANTFGSSAVNIHGADQNGLGANVLFDGVTVQYSNWIGLYSTHNFNLTMQNSTFTQNGEDGVEVQQPKNFLFTGNTVTYNNWRAYSGCPSCTGWDMDGAKFLRGHGVEVDNSTFANNLTGGLWFDFDNENICVQTSQFHDNLTNGLFIEATQGPVLLYQDQVYQNGANGLQTANSENVTVRQSTVYDNGAAGLFIGGQTAGRSVSDWETGGNYSLIAENWIYDGVNFATGPHSATGAYLLNTSLGTIAPFTSTLWTDYNDYYAPSNSTPFYPSSAKTYAQWLTLISGNGFSPGQDVNSNQNSITSNALPAAPTCIGWDCPGGPRVLVIDNTGADEKFKVQSVNTLAQSFVAIPNISTISKIQLGLARSKSSGTDHSTTVHLRSTLTGTDLWSTTFTPTVSSSDYSNPSWIDVPVSPAISVTPGATYYLVVTTSNTSTTDYYYWSVSSTQTYPSGFFYSNGTQKSYSSYLIFNFQ
jgi:Right handed beta helix region